MPFVDTGTSRAYYRLDGLDDAPVVVLSHSLGLDHGMWDAQLPDLLRHARVLRYDLRGHGASSAPVGEYTIAALGEDVLGLVDALGIRTFAFCGLSIGGMIGQWLGGHHPDRLTRLVLANTSPRVADPGAMETRRLAVLERGMPAVVETALGRFFSPERLAGPSPVVATVRRTLLATSPVGYAGCCAAVRDMDHRALLREIRVPTLVISGDRDVSMPWPDHGQRLADAIPDVTVVRLPAAHLSNLERPRSFGAALARFLVAPPADRSEAGMAMRRSVLGDAHVDRAIESTTELTRAFQDLITRYAWGTIWTRPGLDPRTRRLLVLATTAALGRWEEFRLHLRTGLARELEWCDLEEVLLQTAIYAGVPAANSGFHAAAEERQRQDQAAGGSINS
jgi:3-oxoadipate enol-lactonase / 4-carboxymuconolactone decarboxylase